MSQTPDRKKDKRINGPGPMGVEVQVPGELEAQVVTRGRCRVLCTKLVPWYKLSISCMSNSSKITF